MSIGIGADTNLFTKSDKARVMRTLNIFNKVSGKHGVKKPWLDVGAGESYMRDLLVQKINKKMLTSEIDLDETKYDYEDGSIQTITSFEILEHLFNPLFHLKELYRILSPDGNLYLTTPNDYSLIYKAEHLLSRKYRPHFHQFCERDLEDIFEKAGFPHVRIKKFFRSASGTIARISRNGFLVHAKKCSVSKESGQI